jgi:hypothetical protein
MPHVSPSETTPPHYQPGVHVALGYGAAFVTEKPPNIGWYLDFLMLCSNKLVNE